MSFEAMKQKCNLRSWRRKSARGLSFSFRKFRWHIYAHIFYHDTCGWLGYNNYHSLVKSEKKKFKYKF